MKHLAQRLLDAKNALLGTGLAFALCAAATTAPAAAQRLQAHKGGSQWEIGVSKNTRRGSAAITVGSRGVSLDLQRGRAQAPRGYDGGRYEYRNERTWVPGYNRQVWVEPVYEWRYQDCGPRYQVLVRDGYYRNVSVPGRYQNRQVKVWVPARGISVRSNRGRSSRANRVSNSRSRRR